MKRDFLPSRRDLIELACIAPLLTASQPVVALPPASTLFGVNCYDLVQLAFLGRPQSDPRERLLRMADLGVRLVRFSVSPFWPDHWRRYYDDPSRLDALLDRTAEAAERTGIQLIPCFLWNPASLAYFAGERLSQWGGAKSRSWALAEEFIARSAAVLANHHSVAIWEFSNEFDSFADMARSEDYFPALNVKHGTPAHRTAADRYTYEQVANSYSRFSRIIRSLVPGALISSGANSPRNDLIRSRTGRKGLDSPAELREAFLDALPDGVNVLSIHLYRQTIRPRFSGQGTDYASFLKMARAAADERNARLLVGEFGIPLVNDTRATRAKLEEMMSAIRSSGADYACYWVYDYRDGPASPYNVSGDEHSWVLRRLAALNR